MMNIYIYAIVGMLSTFFLCIGTLFFYLKYKKNILQQQFKHNEAEVKHQKALLQAVITTEEKERKRIGMDLHDEVGTVLSLLRLTIENYTDKANSNKPSEHEFNNQCKSSIDMIIQSVRQISHNLSPTIKGQHGFHDAVLNLCDGINQSRKIKINVTFENDTSKIKIDEPVALSFYRVIAELINNTIKHANAHEINLLFSQEENVFSILYSDDGMGLPLNYLDSSGKGMGMRNIESRLAMIDATFEIENNIGFKARILKSY